MLTTLLALSFVGCGPKPASIKLDGDPIVTVNTFESIPLKKADVLDKNGQVVKSANKVVWTLNPDTVLRLEGENLKPLTNGEATVIASSGTLKAQYQVIVAVPDRIMIQGYTAGTPVAVNSNVLLKADVMAGDKIVAGQQLSWRSSDEAVATVSNGRVTGTGIGAVTVFATSGKLEARIDIQVVEALPVEEEEEEEAYVDDDVQIVRAAQPYRAPGAKNTSSKKKDKRGKGKRKHR